MFVDTNSFFFHSPTLPTYPLDPKWWANLSLMASALGSVFYLTNFCHWACVILPMCFGTNCFFTYFLFISDFHLRNNCPILTNDTLFINSSSTPSGYLIFSVIFLQSCSFVVSGTSRQFWVVMETLSLNWNPQVRLNAFLASVGSIRSHSNQALSHKLFQTISYCNLVPLFLL
jgi:hypothetical protein